MHTTLIYVYVIFVILYIGIYTLYCTYIYFTLYILYISILKQNISIIIVYFNVSDNVGMSPKTEKQVNETKNGFYALSICIMFDNIN